LGAHLSSSPESAVSGAASRHAVEQSSKTSHGVAYRPDIDGLRTLAVMLVLVFHFNLFELGKAGFIGVDIFFVISGFLITAIIRRDLDLGRFRFVDFLYRRVRRLYPALMATLGATLIAGTFLFFPYRLEELATETVLSLLYVVNFYFWQKINYFGLQAGAVPLLHIWSLAIEEQFYLVFPIVCAFIWHWNRKLLAPLVVVGAVFSFLLAVLSAPEKPELAFYLLPTRAWELLLGSMLALGIHNRTPRGAGFISWGQWDL
jgi:peptidoglycan/LPS O-acetylase OafA/YrhL